MPEWSIGTVSKTVVPLRVPRVRIPVFPQYSLIISDLQNEYPKKYPQKSVFGYFFGYLFAKTLIFNVRSGERGSRTYAFRKYHKIANH